MYLRLQILYAVTGCICKNIPHWVTWLLSSTGLIEESLPGRRGEQAWRALLQAHATLIRQLDTDLREDTGLRLADFDVLAQLAAAGGELRMTELAARTLSRARADPPRREVG